MKKLAFAVLSMLSVNTFADSFFMPNKDGGEIVITTNACIVGKEEIKGALEAYAFSPSAFVKGCWFIKEGDVMVIYETGETRVYKMEQFQVKQAAPKPEKRRDAKQL